MKSDTSHQRAYDVTLLKKPSIIIPYVLIQICYIVPLVNIIFRGFFPLFFSIFLCFLYLNAAGVTGFRFQKSWHSRALILCAFPLFGIGLPLNWFFRDYFGYIFFHLVDSAFVLLFLSGTIALGGILYIASHGFSPEHINNVVNQTQPQQLTDDVRKRDLILFAILISSNMVLALIVGIILIFIVLSRGNFSVGFFIFNYILVSLIAFAFSLLTGITAIKKSDTNKAFCAGVYALLGGIQHLGILGVPAIIAGIKLLKYSSTENDVLKENKV